MLVIFGKTSIDFIKWRYYSFALAENRRMSFSAISPSRLIC
jgi:hypothetical protein